MRRIRALWLRFERKLTGTDDRSDGGVVLRMTLVIAALLAGFVGVVAQASVYQLSEDQTLAERGNQRVNDAFTLEGRRGSIMDRTGRRVMAVSVPVPSVAFYGAPYFVDRTELAYALAEVLDLKADDVLRKIIAEERFAMVKRHVSDAEAAAVEKLQLPGIRIIHEERRQYPMGALLGSVLGYVGKSGQGLAGIEAFYDHAVRGTKRTLNVLRDAARRGFYNDPMTDPWTLDGADLVLNIDAQVQLALESELVARVEAEGALGGMAVALDPNTFEVLAMSSVPTLDPNQFETECGGDAATKPDDGSSPCRNKVVSYVYEPGSVGKILTLAAGLTSGRLHLSDTVDGHLGRCKVGKFDVKDVHPMGIGTLSEATMYSSNCAFKELALRIGADTLHDEMEAFGIGHVTGVDLPGEARGLLHPADKWGSTGLQVTGYGYSYAMTPMHMALAMAEIANGGLRGAPRVARELRTNGGRTVKKIEAPALDRVMTVQAAADAREALTTVVMEKHGTGVKARPTNYTAGGKTGTARVTVAHEGYKGDRYLCSFVGFAPVEDPRLVIAITLIDPKVDKYGGTAAAPVFKAVADRVLPMLGVMPRGETAQVGSVAKH